MGTISHHAMIIMLLSAILSTCIIETWQLSCITNSTHYEAGMSTINYSGNVV